MTLGHLYGKKKLTMFLYEKSFELIKIMHFNAVLNDPQLA